MLFFRRHKKLASFDEEKKRYGTLQPRKRGVETIEVGKIVGSVDRSQDLDDRFRWKGSNSRAYRTRCIEKAMERGDILPPIEVYELDQKYFVVDGHHRVGAAKKLGQEFMDAEVTSFVPT